MIQPSLRAQGVLAWPLGDGRRIAEPNAFLEALAPQLLGAGVPVHPHNHRGADPEPQSVVVQRAVGSGFGASERRYRLGAADVAASLESSPIKIVYEGGAARFAATRNTRTKAPCFRSLPI